MLSSSLIETAHRKSRQRAILFGVAGLTFLAVQVLTRPPFATGDYAHGWRAYAWALNAALLLMLLAGGGGFAHPRQLRELIHDDVARDHNRTACKAGFWVAMACALALAVIPSLQALTAHQASYLVVTLGAGTAVLSFAWLELRSHADA